MPAVIDIGNILVKRRRGKKARDLDACELPIKRRQAGISVPLKWQHLKPSAGKSEFRSDASGVGALRCGCGEQVAAG
jgi:hypothetical protein